MENCHVSAFTGYVDDILLSVASPKTFVTHLCARASLTCQSVAAMGVTLERIKNADAFFQKSHRDI